MAFLPKFSLLKYPRLWQASGQHGKSQTMLISDVLQALSERPGIVIHKWLCGVTEPQHPSSSPAAGRRRHSSLVSSNWPSRGVKHVTQPGIPPGSATRGRGGREGVVGRVGMGSRSQSEWGLPSNMRSAGYMLGRPVEWIPLSQVCSSVLAGRHTECSHKAAWQG